MIGQVPDFTKPTGMTGGKLTVKVLKPYTDSSNNTTLSEYYSEAQIIGGVFRWIDQNTSTRLAIPAQGTGDPVPPMAEIMEILTFASGPESRNFYRVQLRETSTGTFNYRVEQTGAYTQNYPVTIQQAQDVYEAMLPLLEQAQTALASLTDVTVTAETSKTITLRFDDDPLASAGLTTTVSALQSAVTALDTRVDTAETDIITLDGRIDANDASLNTLDGRLDIAEADIDALQALPSDTPIGTVVGWGKITAPAGWLACNGQEVSRVTYAALFAEIGTVYGAGDGSTTFKVPDLRGRVPVGAGTGAGLTSRTMGQTGGTETHTLTIAEMPEHNHGIDNPTEGEPGLVLRSIVGQTTTVNTSDSTQSGTEPQVGYGDPGEPDPMTGIPMEGGGGAHNNMQPFVVLQFIIRAQ